MVSIVIPSFNSELTIERNLLALQEQTYDSELEIILVDSSTDSTPHIVSEKFPSVHLVHLDEKTDPGTARNLGVARSRGDLVLFIDSDCIAAPDWVDTLVSLHSVSDYAAIGGAVSNGNPPDSLIAWAGYFAEFREFIPTQKRKEVSHIPTCNISYKAWVFDQIGGFDPEFYPQEDLEFNFRLTQSGNKIFFCPEARVQHIHRTTLGSFFAHQRKIGAITARVLRILPLTGSKLVRNRWIAALSLPVLPAVKWLRTMSVFLRHEPELVAKRIPAMGIFAFGLVPWTVGFFQGVFADD